MRRTPKTQNESTKAEMQLWYDHLTRSSNISEYTLWIDAKVGENYRTLSSCITTLSLKEIVEPALPTIVKKVSQEESIQAMAQAIANAITQSTATRSFGSLSAAPQPQIDKSSSSSKKKSETAAQPPPTNQSREISQDEEEGDEEGDEDSDYESQSKGGSEDADSDEADSVDSESDHEEELNDAISDEVSDEIKLLRYNVLFKDYVDRRQDYAP